MKVYVAQQKLSGIGKYRIDDPHIQLANDFPDITVEILDNQDLLSEDFIKTKTGESILFFHNSYLQQPKILNVAKKAKDAGFKIVVDIDDYWKFPPQHPLAIFAAKQKIGEYIKQLLKFADLVTTTTPELAKKIININKNVVVLPNFINQNEKQFSEPKTESPNIRIGYVAGSSHKGDIKLLQGLYSSLLKYDNIEFYLCGFDNRSRNLSTGEVTTINEGSTWHNMEILFTDNYRNLPERYIEQLHNFDSISEIVTHRYNRVWTKGIHEYAKIYANLDIVLAPLTDNEYNNCKSELKMLEAGMYGLPIVCSDVAPYKLLGVDGENCLFVPESKKHKAWISSVSNLIENPELRNKLGTNLRDKILTERKPSTITKQRKQAYEQIFT